MAGSCRDSSHDAKERRAISELKIERIDDLLTPEEQRQLDADLAEIARRRRRAMDAAANIPMA